MKKSRRWITFAESKSNEQGFTLIEMIVAIALFAIVMLVAVGSLLALTAANKKAQALQSVMNNLNVSLDSMVRNLRMGTEYRCGVGSYVGGGAGDCASGGTAITFTCNPAVPDCSPGGRWSYEWDNGSSNNLCVPAGQKAICKSVDNGTNWNQITSPEVQIENMAFYVTGTDHADTVEPKVIIELKGSAGGGSARTTTTFHIQTIAVQRTLDL